MRCRVSQHTELARAAITQAQYVCGLSSHRSFNGDHALVHSCSVSESSYYLNKAHAREGNTIAIVLRKNTNAKCYMQVSRPGSVSAFAHSCINRPRAWRHSFQLLSQLARGHVYALAPARLGRQRVTMSTDAGSVNYGLP